MKKSLLLFLFAISVNLVSAQSQRLVLIEEFTQASCGPCASANPAFNSFLASNTSKAVSIKYQTNWPGVDPMNAQNPAEIRTRVDYYGVTGVPTAYMDGNGPSGNPSVINQTNLNTEYAKASPFTITLNHWFNAANDSIFINCEVTCSQNVTMTTPRLRIAMIEKTITFATAPGSNGEKVFYNVMRKMYPGPKGSDLAASWTVGQKKTVSFAAKIPSYIYSKAQIATLAWIQDDKTKNTLQAGFSSTASAPLSSPPVSDFESDVVSTCDGFVHFKDQSALFPYAWSWDFGDATTSKQKNPIHQYTASGTYNVKLTTTNANGDNVLTKNSYITVNILGNAPTSSDAHLCNASSANLSATAAGIGTLFWYDANGALVHTGPNYSPKINGTTQFYVAEGTPNPIVAVGAKDTAVGVGSFFTANNTHGLYFNVTKPSVLLSVKCFANTAGNRTISVLDNNSVTVQSATVNMTAGMNSVNLNFPLGVGNGYLLKVNSTTVDLYRNTAGATFPYTIGPVSITGNTSAGKPGYYYYFYDWQLQENPCTGPGTKVRAIDSCNIFSINDPKDIETAISIFPNPNNGVFNTVFNTEQNDNYIITISNALGQVVYQENLNNFSGNYSRAIDVSSYGKGIYLLSVSGTSGDKTIKKLIVY